MPRKVLILAATAALAALLAGCQRPPAEPAEFHDARSFPAGEGKLVRLDVGSLDPEIEVAAADTITVEVRLSAHASSRAAAARWVERHAPKIDDSPAALEIRAVRRGGTLIVGFLRTHSHLRVVVPPSCGLEITTSSGDVSIDGRETLTAPARITTTSGDITVRGGVRALEVRTVSGDLKATGNGLEQLQLRSTSGDATVHAPLRTVLADTTSGDLRLENLIGDLSAYATSGDLRAEWADLPVDASIRAETTSGDVRLTLPSLTGVTGELRTRSGSVRTHAPGRWERKDRYFVLVPVLPGLPPAEAAPGSGGVTIKVSTRSGDILLRSS